MNTHPDRSTEDLTRTIIALRPDLRIFPQVYGDEDCVHIEDPISAEQYRVGAVEYSFLSLLDGGTTFSEALALTARSQGPQALPREQALELYAWLLERGLATFISTSSAASGEEGRKWSDGLQKFLQQLNPFWIRIPLGRPNELLKKLHPVVGWIVSPASGLFTVVLALIAARMIIGDWQRFEESASLVFSPDNWLILLAVWVILKLIHEIGHGLACLTYDGEVREAGIIFAFLAPMAYVDVTSSWSFPSRFRRMHVAIAGMQVEIMIASAAALLWQQTTDTNTALILQNVVMMAGVSTVLFNANPLMRFDGYYLLSDFLQIPNLYTRSAEKLRGSVTALLTGMPDRRSRETGSSSAILLCYGAASAFWKLVISSTLLIGASVLFHGAGMLMAAVGIIVWFGIPLWNLVQFSVRLCRESPSQFFRGASLGAAAVGTVCAVLILVPAPVNETAAGIVEYPDGGVIRADSSGFVLSVLVEDGMFVETGDVLLKMSNAELESELRDVQCEIEEEETRWRTASRTHDAAGLSISEQRLGFLEERREQLQTQVDHLTVCAATTGTVLIRRPADLPGTWVEEGQELLAIDSGQNFEFRLLVRQANWGLARQLVGKDVAVRIGTRTLIPARLMRLEPGASRILTVPALAATAGGPLPVEQIRDDSESDDGMQLTEQHFAAILQLPESARELTLSAGERGYAALDGDDRSLGRYCFESVRDWFRNQLEFARDAERQA